MFDAVERRSCDTTPVYETTYDSYMIPHGPHPIGAKRQVVVPSQVMKNADLHPGDGVYFEVLDDPAGCVLMIPVEVAEQWWQAGKTAVQDRLSDPRGDERQPGSGQP